MQDFIYQAVAYGRNHHLFLAEVHINGSMNHVYMVGRRKENISGIQEEKKPPYGNLKPIALLAYPISNSSMSNTLILDPFGGSGSTLIACEQTDRSCYTIELDEKFCDVIVKRYIEQVGTDKDVSVLRDGKEYQYSEVTADE